MGVETLQRVSTAHDNRDVALQRLYQSGRVGWRGWVFRRATRCNAPRTGPRESTRDRYASHQGGVMDGRVETLHCNVSTVIRAGLGG